MIGRFGNNMFQFAHAKAFAEKNELELRMDPWVGEKVFTLGGYKPVRPNGSENFVLRGYFQNQESLNYTRADCRRWFKIRDELLPSLVNFSAYCEHAHLRRGDYAGYGYPVISRKAVDAAQLEHQYQDEFRKNYRGPQYAVVSDEQPLKSPLFVGEMAFLPDFYRLMRAPLLYRGNSSFSYWAAVLGHGKVFSPIIKGLVGGVEHDNVPFVPGNWPALADLQGITDLHLPEK